MSNLYHSDVHMPRWKRVVLWLVESKPGRFIYFTLGAAIALAPMYWLGIWWVIAGLIAFFSFLFGWNAAVRAFKRDGYINKL